MEVKTNGKPDINKMARAFNEFIDALDKEELEQIDKEQYKNNQELRAG